MDKTIDKIVRHADYSEKAIERYLAARVKELGGLCLKYSNAGMVGFPDCRAGIRRIDRILPCENLPEGDRPYR